MIVDRDGRHVEHALTTNGADGIHATYWMSTLEAARLLGYRTDKPIMRAIKAGHLTASRAPCGRGMRVKLVDLERWIETHLAYQPPTAAAPAGAIPRPAHRRRKTSALRYKPPSRSTA
jgi:excisionase family DNA binding protein